MRRTLLVLAAIYVLVYVAPLGVLPLFSPDETRYAEIPREMLQSGDWVVPRLDGLRYFEKPPLGYWVTAASIAAFGENKFAVRLPSAVSAGLTALIVLLLTHRLSRKPLAGPLAAAVYLTSLLVFVVGSISVLDGLLTLLLTGALASFFCAYSGERPGGRRSFLALGGACCGLAFLTKGFLALVVPVLVLVPFLWLEKRWRSALSSAWLPAAAALAVALPWSVWIHFREPDFWHFFFWNEHMRRFLNPGGRSQHPQPFWYFLPVLVGSLLLWLPLAGAVFRGHRSQGRLSPLSRFALLWFSIPLVFFSASGGKLATYVLPCCPPLAILIAEGLAGESGRRRGRDAFCTGALAGALVPLAAFLIATLVGRAPYAEDETWKWALALAALIGWGLAAIAAALDSRRDRRLWIYASAPLLLMFSLHWLVPRAAAEARSIGSFLERRAAEVAEDAIVVTDHRAIQAVCWHLKRSDVYLLSTGELAYGLGYDDSRHRLLSATDLATLLTDESRDRDVILILRPWALDELAGTDHGAGRLPEPASRVEGHGLIWARYGRP